MNLRIYSKKNKKIYLLVCFGLIMCINIIGCNNTKTTSDKLTIYLVRHGQTNTNVEGLLVGQSGSPQLTQDGIDKAIKLGEGIKDINFDAAYSSSLLRACDTANFVLQGANQKLDVELVDELMDISWGDAEGMTWAEVAEKYAVSNFGECFGKYDDPNFESPINAESKYDFCERFSNGMQHIIDNQKSGDNVLVVAHSSLSFYLQCLFPDEQIGGVDNTSVSVITYDYSSGKYDLIDLNNTSYIQ